MRAFALGDGRQFEVGRVALFRVEGQLLRQGGSLLVPAEGALVHEASDGRMQIGAIELSNTTPLEATVEMINAQRSFDHSLQAIETYRKLDERMSTLGRVS